MRINREAKGNTYLRRSQLLLRKSLQNINYRHCSAGFTPLKHQRQDSVSKIVHTIGSIRLKCRIFRCRQLRSRGSGGLGLGRAALRSCQQENSFSQSHMEDFSLILHFFAVSLIQAAGGGFGGFSALRGRRGAVPAAEAPRQLFALR